jgi:hypothetical protein
MILMANRAVILPRTLITLISLSAVSARNPSDL